MNQYIKNFNGEGVINPYRIIAIGAADGGVRQAAAVGDAIIGVSVIPANKTAADSERVDVGMDRMFPVEYGGVVARGDWLTTDASGRAVTAAPAAGANNSVIGRAEVSGISGDIVDVYVRPGQIQG